MSEKVALVTGAGSGIGRAVALVFLRNGYRVVLAGRRLQALQETIEIANVDTSQTLAVATDRRNRSEISSNAVPADRRGIQAVRRAV